MLLVRKTIIKDEIIFDEVLNSPLITSPDMLIDKDFLGDVGLFDENMKTAEDIDNEGQK